MLTMQQVHARGGHEQFEKRCPWCQEGVGQPAQERTDAHRVAREDIRKAGK